MQDTKTLISIIVPIYNASPFIDKCIESICAQTYQNIEIILVDDGSTDGSAEKIEKYKQEDERIIAMHIANSGQGAARNRGLDICKGEYITFLDADDVMQNDCIETLLCLCNEKKCDIAVGNYLFRSENGQSMGIYGKTKHIGDITLYSNLEALEVVLYQQEFDSQVWGKLYRRDLFENIRFAECREMANGEDLAIIYKLILKAAVVAFIDKVIIEYMIRTDSVTHREFEHNKMLMLDIIEEIENYVKGNCPEVYRAVECRIVSIAFMLAITMKDTDEYDVKDYIRCITCIKKYRNEVILNKKARRKTRIAALMSYLGMHFVTKVYKMVKKTNPVY